jgi:hypothetical protein
MNDNLIDQFESYVNMEDTKDKYKTITKSYTLCINSKDRLLTDHGDTNYDFSVNFNSVNTNALNIGKNFKNIKSVHFLGMVIPNIYLDIKEVLSLYNHGLITSDSNPIRCMRISDLPYLLLHINEIKNNTNFGSNNQLNKSTFILVMDDTNIRTNNNSGTYSVAGNTFSEHGNINNTILAGTDRRVIYFKSITPQPINYYSTPYSYLNNLKITITTPEGTLLSNLNNFLECSSIKYDTNTTHKLIITFSNYFCADEYSLGDKLIFKDIVVSNTSLTNFLMRQNGHTIIKIDGNGSGGRQTKLYNKISIPFEYTINLSDSTGNSSINNTFNLPTTGITDIPVSGKAINSSLQTTFAMNIVNEERDEPKLHGNII